MLIKAKLGVGVNITADFDKAAVVRKRIDDFHSLTIPIKS
jgi:hypothetical protein